MCMENIELFQGWSDSQLFPTLRKSELEYLESEIDKVQTRVNAYLRMHMAATTIQRFYRSSSRHLLLLNQRESLAAACIQRHFRSHLDYLRSRPPPPDPDHCARVIQRCFRQHRFRKLVFMSGMFIKTVRLFVSLALSRSRRAALKYGCRWRGIAAARRAKRDHQLRTQSARRIQRQYRLHVARKERKSLFIMQIQLRWRMKAARLQAERERRKQLELRTLQIMHMQNWADGRYREIVIKRIQARWREFVLNKRIKNFTQKRAVGIIETKIKDRKVKELEFRAALVQNGAARTLQGAFRAAMDRRRFNRIRRLVLKVQAKWRRFVALRKLKLLASEARAVREMEMQAAVIKNLLKKDMADYLEMLVRKCQAVWRGKITRRKIIHEQLIRDKNEAVIRLVAIQESADYKELVSASSLIKAVFRGRQVRLQFLAIKFLVTKIQARWRGFVARRAIRRLHEEQQKLEVVRALLRKDQELYKELLVRQVQNLWRAKIKRRKLAEAEAKAAVKIQANWRGVAGRKEAELLRQQELFDRYKAAREVEDNLRTASRQAFKDFGVNEKVVLLADDVPGLIRGGQFISGPLRGFFLSDLAPGSLTAEEIEIYRTKTEEEVVDVDKAAAVIQTAWKMHRRVKGERGIKRNAHSVLQKWAIRSKGRLAAVFGGGGGLPEQALSTKEAVYDQKGVVITGDRIRVVGDRKGERVVIKTPLNLVVEGKLECVYFSVILTEVFSGSFADGLTLGVTDGISDVSHLTGYDGHAYSAGEFVETEFVPNSLKIGDRVGCMVVFPEGDLLYLVNDEVRAVAEVKIKKEGVFYPVIEMLGSAKEVRLSTKEKPPIITLEEEAQGKMEPKPERELQEMVEGMFEDLATRSAALFGKEEETLPEINTWISFNRKQYDKKLVQVSTDALTAEYVGLKNPPERYVAKGVLVTEKPVPRQGNLLFFQVEVVEQVQGFVDGLTVGFFDGKDFEVPDTADGLEGEGVWVAGFDGQWYSTQLGWGELGWNGNTLKEGDRVGVVAVLPAGDLLILVNDDIVAEAPLRVPSGRRLFGVVDLLGSTNAVRLDVDAKPPRIELN